MLVQAVTITINVMIDIDDMSPDVRADVVIDPSFSFLAQTPDLLSNWVSQVAESLTNGASSDD